MASPGKTISGILMSLKGLSPNQRLIGLVVVALIVGIGWTQFGRSGKQVRVKLFGEAGKIRDFDVDRMQIAFGKAGLNDYEIEDGVVYVSKSERDEYLKALSENDAVPEWLEEIKPPSGFLPSRQDRAETAKNNKKRFIRRLVSHLSFVDEVYVDYDELKKSGWPPSVERTAAIVVKPIQGRVLRMHEVEAIRNTICGAVAGLKKSEIVITDVAASHSYVVSENGQGNVVSQSQPTHLREAVIALKIREALEAYGDVRVNVSLFEVSARSGDVSPTLPAQPAKHTRPAEKEENQQDQSEAIDQPVANQPVRLKKNQTPHSKKAEPEKVAAIPASGQQVPGSRPRNRINVSIGIPESSMRKQYEAHFPANHRQSNELRPTFESYFQSIQGQMIERVRPLVASDQSMSGQIVVVLDPDMNYVPGTASAETWWRDGIRQYGAVVAAVLGALFLGWVFLTMRRPARYSDSQSFEGSPSPSGKTKANRIPCVPSRNGPPRQ